MIHPPEVVRALGLGATGITPLPRPKPPEILPLSPEARIQRRTAAEGRGAGLFAKHGPIPAELIFERLRTHDPDDVGDAVALARGAAIANLQAKGRPPEQIAAVKERFDQIEKVMVEEAYKRTREAELAAETIKRAQAITPGAEGRKQTLAAEFAVGAERFGQKIAGGTLRDLIRTPARFVARHTDYSALSREERAYWGSFGAGPRTIGITKGLGAEDLADWADRVLKDHPHWTPKEWEAGVGALEDPLALMDSVISSIPLMAASVVSTSVGHPEAAMMLIYAVENQNAYEEAFEYAMAQPGATEESAKIEADRIGQIVGAVNALLEYFQIKGIMRVTGLGKTKLGKTTLRSVIMDIARRANGANRGAHIATLARDVLSTVGKEYLQEGSQEIIATLVPVVLQDRDFNTFDMLDMLDRANKAGLSVIPLVAVPGAGRVAVVAGKAAAAKKPTAAQAKAAKALGETIAGQLERDLAALGEIEPAPTAEPTVEAPVPAEKRAVAEAKLIPAAKIIGGPRGGEVLTTEGALIHAQIKGVPEAAKEATEIDTGWVDTSTGVYVSNKVTPREAATRPPAKPAVPREAVPAKPAAVVPPVVPEAPKAPEPAVRPAEVKAKKPVTKPVTEAPKPAPPSKAEAVKQKAAIKAGDVWKLTQQKFRDYIVEHSQFGPLEIVNMDRWYAMHQREVKTALEAGKLVPAEVLKPYPKLAALAKKVARKPKAAIQFTSEGETLTGKPVSFEGFEDYQFAIVRKSANDWSVYELTTGKRIAPMGKPKPGRNRGQTIKAVHSLLKFYGKEGLDKAIAEGKPEVPPAPAKPAAPDVTTAEDYTGKYGVPGGMMPFESDAAARQEMYDFLMVFANDPNRSLDRRRPYAKAAAKILDPTKVVGDVREYTEEDWRDIKGIGPRIASRLARSFVERSAEVVDLQHAQRVAEAKPEVAPPEPAAEPTEKVEARPEKIGGEPVITKKTEQHIQTLKARLIADGALTPTDFERQMKGLRIKQPRFVSEKDYITEEKGHDLITKMNDEAPVIRERLAIAAALEAEGMEGVQEHWEGIDKEIRKRRKRKALPAKASQLWGFRHFMVRLERLTGLPVSRLWELMNFAHLDIAATKEAYHARIEAAVGSFRKIARDREASDRVSDWIASKAANTTIEAPSDITADEIKVAKIVQEVMTDFRPLVRLQRVLDYIHHEKPIPNAPQQGLDKAKEIYETQGVEALEAFLTGKDWGLLKYGYEPEEWLTRGIERHPPSVAAFGKGHLRVRETAAQVQERNLFQRLDSYMQQVLNAIYLEPHVRNLVREINEHQEMFADPKSVAEAVSLAITASKKSPSGIGFWGRKVKRIAGQAMRAIFLKPVLAFRNLFQNPAFNEDFWQFQWARMSNRTLTAEELAYFRRNVSQSKVLRREYLMQAEKPLLGLRTLSRAAEAIPLYAWSDTINRLGAFWMRINKVHRAVKGVDLTKPKSVLKMMRAAGMQTMDPLLQRRALEILAKDGVDAMAMYVASVHTMNVHFAYERGQRSASEMGPTGEILGSLVAFPRSWAERVTLEATKLVRGGKYTTRRAAAARLIQMTVVAHLVGMLFQVMTGRERRNPYWLPNILNWTPGGLLLGVVADVVKTTETVRKALMDGDKQAAARAPQAITHTANTFIPFYATMTDMVEALSDTQNVDRYALRKLREYFSKGYKPDEKAYKNTRTNVEKLQKALFGSYVGKKQSIKRLRKAYRYAITLPATTPQAELKKIGKTLETERRRIGLTDDAWTAIRKSVAASVRRAEAKAKKK